MDTTKARTLPGVTLVGTLLLVLSLFACCGMRWLPAAFLGLQITGVAALPQASVGVEYRRGLQADGGTAPYRWSLHGGHLPAGLTLSDDGVIAGQPELPGEFSLEIWVADSAGHTVSRRLTLPVAWSGLAIVTSNPELPWARAGSEYQVRLTAAGGLPPFRWKALAPLPEGLSLSANGALGGTPLRGGDFVLNVQVSDLRGQSAQRQFHLHVSGAAVDQFGGVLAVRSAAKPTGAWHMEKLNGRWVFVTPAGHAFWMLGVWFVSGDEHKDERGATYDQRTKSKYGATAISALQTYRRLHAWGFNTIGPYSYRMMLPTDNEPEWEGQQPVRFPFVWMAQQAAFNGRREGFFKNLYAGVRGEGGGNFPDVFDPAWVKHTYDITANNPELRAMSASPYFIGAFGDDTDYLSGFGPGTDFVTQPPDKIHAHLGYIALITAPTQATNRDGGQPYRDTKVYTKYRLRDFLQAKYGSIAALNAAWGSTYTTFDSDGGWPDGRGLLDESGRQTHQWLGGDQYLRGAGAAVTADLDEFLYQMAHQFFSTEREAFRMVAPKALFFGPTNIGGWRAPARAPIYRAAR